jgi:Uma2 family endonuclease
LTLRSIETVKFQDIIQRNQTFESLNVASADNGQLLELGLAHSTRTWTIMRPMSIRTTRSEVLEATEHLPDEAILFVHGFEWDEYERLLDDLRDSRQLRVSYDSGRLRIMSISPEHEEYATAIEGLILAFCDEAGITAEARGCATWRRETLARGVEADACYYVQNAHRIIGKRQIDLIDDPPPDLVVEVDLSAEVRHKFPIYAALGVSEVWQYEERPFSFIGSGMTITFRSPRVKCFLRSPSIYWLKQCM